MVWILVDSVLTFDAFDRVILKLSHACMAGAFQAWSRYGFPLKNHGIISQTRWNAQWKWLILRWKRWTFAASFSRRKLRGIYWTRSASVFRCDLAPQMSGLSPENDGFCPKYDGLCPENDGFCPRIWACTPRSRPGNMRTAVRLNREKPMIFDWQWRSYTNKWWFWTKTDGFTLMKWWIMYWNGGFCIKHDDFDEGAKTQRMVLQRAVAKVNFAWTMMNFALTLMSFAVNMMDFASKNIMVFH